MKNTRIAVPLSEEAYDAISTVAEMSGVSRGRLLADALEAAIPAYTAVAAAYRAAQAVHGEEREAIVQAMHLAEKKLMAAVAEMDLSGSDPEIERTAPARSPEGGKRAGAGRADPPVTNRGVPTPAKGGQ